MKRINQSLLYVSMRTGSRNAQGPFDGCELWNEVSRLQGRPQVTFMLGVRTASVLVHATKACGEVELMTPLIIIVDIRGEDSGFCSGRFIFGENFCFSSFVWKMTLNTLAERKHPLLISGIEA
jgi:hypothetical protein